MSNGTNPSFPNIDSTQLVASLEMLQKALKMVEEAVVSLTEKLIGLSTQLYLLIDITKQIKLQIYGIEDSISSVLKQVKKTSQNFYTISNLATQQLLLIQKQKEEEKKINDELEKQKKAREESIQKLANMLKSLFSGLLDISLKIIGMFATAFTYITKFAIRIMNPLNYLEALGKLTKFYEDFLRVIENIRTEFGEFSKGQSNFITQTAKTIDSSLKKVGLSAYRIIGTPTKVLEEMFQFFKDLGAAGAEAFRRFGDSAINNLYIVQKGLGLTTDDAAFLAESAMSSGKSIGKVTSELIKMTTAMGKKINESPKTIARSVVTAMKDLDKFGGATVKQLVKADVYMRKLGTTLDKTAGLMQRFETIEGAAEASSKLAQYFGVTVDAFKMLMAQEPAEIVDELRRGFRNAGVEVSNFNRHQYALLVDSLGLEAQTGKTVLSLLNQGAAYNDISASAEGAAKSQMTEAEALNKISDSIERLVHVTESNVFMNLFTAFSDGFMAIDSAKQAMQAFYDEAVNLQEIGIGLAKTLYETFPGVKGIFESLKNILNGNYISGFFKDFTAQLGDFFKSIEKGELSFEGAWETMKKKFFAYFDQTTPEGKKLMKNIKVFLVGARDMVIFFIKGIGSEIVNAFKGVSDPNKVKTYADTFAGTLGFAFNEVLIPIGKALWETLSAILKEALPVIMPVVEPILKEAFMLMGKIIYGLFVEFVWPAIESAWNNMSGWMKALLFGIFLGPQLVTFFSGIFSLVGGMFVRSAMSAATTRVAAAAASGASSVVQVGIAVPTMTQMFATLVPLVVAFAALMFAIQYGKITAETVASTAAALVAIGLAFLEIGASMALLGLIPKTAVMQGTGTIWALTGSVAALLTAVTGALLVLKGYPSAELKAASVALSELVPGIIALMIALAGLVTTIAIATGGTLEAGAAAIGIALTLLYPFLIMVYDFLEDISFVLAKLLKATKKVDENKINAVSNMMVSNLNLILKLIDVLGMLTIIPSTVLPILRELAGGESNIIKTLFTTVAGITTELIISVSNLQGLDPTKINLFTDVFKSVVNLLGIIVDLSKDSKPKIDEFNKIGPGYINLLNKTINMPEDILTGLSKIILEFKNFVSDPAFNDKSAATKLTVLAKAIQSLSVVGEIASATRDHVKVVLQQFGTEKWNSDNDTTVYKSAIEEPRRFVVQILPKLTSFIKQVVLATSDQNFRLVSADKLNSLVSILKTISDFTVGIVKSNIFSILTNINNQSIEMSKEITAFTTSATRAQTGFDTFSTETLDTMGEGVTALSKNIQKPSDYIESITGTITNIANIIVPALEKFLTNENINKIVKEMDTVYLEKYNIVANVISSVAGIIQGMSPNKEILEKLFNTQQVATTYYENGKPYRDYINNTPLIKELIKDTTNVGESVGKIIDSITNMIKTAVPIINLIPSGSEKKFELFIKLIDSSIALVKIIVDLMSNTLLAAQTFARDIQDKATKGKLKLTSANIQQITRIITKVLSSDGMANFFDIMSTKIPAFVRSIIDIIPAITVVKFTDNQIKQVENLKVIFEMVTAVVTAVNEISNLLTVKKDEIAGVTKAADKAKNTVTQLTEADISTLFDNVSIAFNSIFGTNNPDSLINTINRLILLLKATNAFSTLGDKNLSENITRYFDTVKSILSKVHDIIPIVNNFNSSDYNTFDTTGLSTVFSSLINSNIFTQINELASKAKTSAPNVDNINSYFQSMSGIKFPDLTDLNNSINDFSKSIEIPQLKLESISSLDVIFKNMNTNTADLINNLTALTKIKPIEIKVPVEAVSQGSTNTQLTKEFVAPNVNIDLTVNVQMDASQIESAMLQNSNSQIKSYLSNADVALNTLVNKDQTLPMRAIGYAGKFLNQLAKTQQIK